MKMSNYYVIVCFLLLFTLLQLTENKAVKQQKPPQASKTLQEKKTEQQLKHQGSKVAPPATCMNYPLCVGTLQQVYDVFKDCASKEHQPCAMVDTDVPSGYAACYHQDATRQIPAKCYQPFVKFVTEECYDKDSFLKCLEQDKRMPTYAEVQTCINGLCRCTDCCLGKQTPDPRVNLWYEDQEFNATQWNEECFQQMHSMLNCACDCNGKCCGHDEKCKKQ